MQAICDHISWKSDFTQSVWLLLETSGAISHDAGKTCRSDGASVAAAASKSNERAYIKEVAPGRPTGSESPGAGETGLSARCDPSTR